MKLPLTDYEVMMHELRERFATGATRNLAWRRRQLDGLKRLVEDNEDRIVQALESDLGKPRQEVILGETALILSELKHARARLRRWSRPRRVFTPLFGRPGSSFIQPEPLGVVLIIGPWNYPVQLILAPLVAAIAAGNCALIKPSEIAAATSALMAELIPEYLDPAAFKVVEGGVLETTELLKERFDHIFYTGNATVGRIIMKAAAEHLTPVTLEMGGKSPAVIDAGADLASAARRLAWGKALNAGQTCIAPDYVLVTEDQREPLIEALGAEFRKMYGDDVLASPDYAQIINDRHFERLSGLLGDGEVVVGGRTDAARRRIEPTVLVDVPPDSQLMREEIFGPLLPVISVANLAEAIDVIHQGDKPLAAYLFSRSGESEKQFLAEVSAGSVCINDVMMFMLVPGLPFGGVGASGTGQYHGQAGFDRMSHLKAVMKRGRWPEPSVRFAPYSDFKIKLIKWLS